jgi:chemosensory pili system protein ChpC
VNVEALETEAAAEVACVVVPVPGLHLLLPGACVAEVIPWRQAAPVNQAPPWCHGLVDWRSELVPLVAFDRLGGDGIREAARPQCLVVLHRAGAGSRWRHWALAATGVPRLILLAGNQLGAERPGEAPGEAMRLEIGAETVIIPDLEFVERRLGAILPPD